MKQRSCTSTWHLLHLCFVFIPQQAHFSWVGQGWTTWSVLSCRTCSSTRWSDAANPLGWPGVEWRGPRARQALAMVRLTASKSLVLSTLPCVSRNKCHTCWILTSRQNANIGHHHFLDRMVVRYLSRFGPSGPLNTLLCYIIMSDKERLTNFNSLCSDAWWIALHRVCQNRGSLLHWYSSFAVSWKQSISRISHLSYWVGDVLSPSCHPHPALHCHLNGCSLLFLQIGFLWRQRRWLRCKRHQPMSSASSGEVLDCSLIRAAPLGMLSFHLAWCWRCCCL